MKNAVVILLALVVPTTLWAMDINQGKMELSGQSKFTFSDTSTEVTGEPDIDETRYEFEVDGVYYLRPNLGLGLIFMYDKTETEVAGDSTDFSTFLIGPQVTYNIPVGEKVSLFVNGAVGYATAEVDDQDADGFGYQFGGGLKYFITNAASINGALFYQNISLEDDFGTDIDISGISFGIGLSLYF